MPWIDPDFPKTATPSDLVGRVLGLNPVIDDPQARIAEYIAHRHQRERQILDALSAGPSVIPDVVKRVYVDVAPALHGIAAMSVESHLKKLKREGRVRETVQRDAPSRWELVG